MQAPTQLPQLFPPRPGEGTGDFTPPEDGWHDLAFEVCRDAEGNPELRNKQFHGKVSPDKYQVRLRFRATDDEDASPWKQWVGYSLHEKSVMYALAMAIRKGKPLDPDKPFDLVHYENKPFRGLVTVDEVPANDDPDRILLFPKILKFKPIGAADDDEDEPAKAPAANGAGANPFDDAGPDF